MSDCICPADGFCQRYQREMLGRPREICQGINITPEKAAKYRANWTRVASQQPRSKGAGDHLKEIIAIVGGKMRHDCGCEDMARKMNEWGPDGCRENRQTVTDKLRENAAKLGWWEMVVIGAALVQEPWFNPLDPAGSMVDEAIRRTEVAMDKRPVPTVRNLTYHVCPLKSNEIWRFNIRSLLQRSDLFNGKRVIAIAVGEGLHEPGVIREAFGGGPWRFIEIPNDRELREVATFLPLLEAVANTNDCEATFYAHTKGNSTADSALGATYWRNAMYHHLLDRWEECMKELEYHYFVGTHKMVWPENIRSPFPTAEVIDPLIGNWMHAGTFYWFRHDRVFNRPDWKNILRDRYGAEAWPSIVCPDHRQAKSMFQPWPEDVYPTPNPYNPATYSEPIITPDELRDLGL